LFCKNSNRLRELTNLKNEPGGHYALRYCLSTELCNLVNGGKHLRAAVVGVIRIVGSASPAVLNGGRVVLGLRSVRKGAAIDEPAAFADLAQGHVVFVAT